MFLSLPDAAGRPSMRNQSQGDSPMRQLCFHFPPRMLYIPCLLFLFKSVYRVIGPSDIFFLRAPSLSAFTPSILKDVPIDLFLMPSSYGHRTRSHSHSSSHRDPHHHHGHSHSRSSSLMPSPVPYVSLYDFHFWSFLMAAKVSRFHTVTEFGTNVR